LNKLLHSGEHEWLNDALKNLLKDFEADFPDEAERPKRLAGLVNFLTEASDPDGNPNGIKTSALCDAPMFVKLRILRRWAHKDGDRFRGRYSVSGSE